MEKHLNDVIENKMPEERYVIVEKYNLYKVELEGHEEYIEAEFDYVDPESETCVMMREDIFDDEKEWKVEDNCIYTMSAVEDICIVSGEIIDTDKHVIVKMSLDYRKRYIHFLKNLEKISQQKLVEINKHQKILDNILLQAVKQNMHCDQVTLIESSTFTIMLDPSLTQKWNYWISENQWAEFETKMAQATALYNAMCNLQLPSYATLVYKEPINMIQRFSNQKAKLDLYTKEKTIVYRDETTGNSIIIEKSSFAISTAAKKILDVALIALAKNNYFRGNPESITPTVEINLIDYWIANSLNVVSIDDTVAEKNRIKNYIKKQKDSLKSNLEELRKLRISWTEIDKSDKSSKNYGDMSLISSFNVKRNILTINFDIDMARYLMNGYLMQFPTTLFRFDNRNPNGYAVCRRLARHHCMDKNVANGTENTLGVATLLNELPEVTRYETLIAKNRRDWKVKIKEVLDRALDSTIEIGYLVRWEYRDPRDGTIYNKEEASTLSYNGYILLKVDFVVREEPDQEKRRARRRAEAKQKEGQKLLENEKKSTKRGRPKKTE